MLNKNNIVLILIFLLSLFLHFYKLSTIPTGLNQDETAIGYNAYSIFQTGKDEYGKSFPLYFKSFGDQKLPAYIYLTALSESAFGLDAFAVRFPSALLGSLAVLILYYVVKEMTGDQKLALIASFLFAINPWHIFFSRAAFEDNAGLTFALLGVWMFVFSIRTKKWLFLYLSIIGFALSLYSYNVTRLLAPALLTALIIFHWKVIKQIPTVLKVTLIVLLFVVLVPFLTTFFSPSGISSAHGALITSTDIQAKGIELRSYLVNDSLSFIGTVFFNKYLFIGWQYLQNLVGSVSTDFFFITGSRHGSEGIGNNGTFYLFEFPLILIGLGMIIKNRQKKYYFFLFWAIVTWLTLSLSKEVPHATRGYFFVVPFEIFSAYGLVSVLEWIKSYKFRMLQSTAYILLALFFVYNLTYFFVSYFVRFPTAYANRWREEDKAVALFIKANDSKYQQVIFDTSAGYIYTSLAFYTAFPPKQFQETVKRLPDDSEGFSIVGSFGKYQWRDIDINGNSRNPQTLLIIPQNKLPSNITPVAVFKYPQIPIVLSVKERLVQYPTQEVAYVAIETK